VHGVHPHVEFRCGVLAGKAFYCQQLESLPCLRSHSPLDRKHTGLEQIQFLQAIELLFEIGNLVVRALVTFCKFQSQNIVPAVLGSTETSTSDGSQPGTETTTAAMLEVFYLSKHDEQRVVREVLCIRRLQPFPVCPLSHDDRHAFREFTPRGVVTRLNPLKHAK